MSTRKIPLKSSRTSRKSRRREQFCNDALAAWAEYQATGRHVTGVEADAWMARLELGGQGPRFAIPSSIET